MKFNIYISGVGGQGIGLLSETIIRAADYAGVNAIGVDTHGLAQRGGMVVSHVRIGENIYSPLVPKGEADLAVCLERHEAMRAMNDFLKDKGSIVYYDAVWQPLSVRQGKEKQIETVDIENEAKNRDIKVYKIFIEQLKDARMQNMAILAAMAKNEIIPGVKAEHYENAMKDLLPENVLEKNLELFRSITE